MKALFWTVPLVFAVSILIGLLKLGGSPAGAWANRLVSLASGVFLVADAAWDLYRAPRRWLSPSVRASLGTFLVMFRLHALGLIG